MARNELSYLIVGENFGDKVRLDPEATFTLGRQVDNTIVINAESVSHYHAELSFGDDGWNIKDNNSRNGISVNGEKTKVSLLADGDIILIGAYRVLFRTDGGKEENMNGNKWFVFGSGKELGPYNDDEMIEFARTGKITPDTLIKLNDDPEWHEAEQIDGLFDPTEKNQQTKQEPVKHESSHIYHAASSGYSETDVGEKVVTCPHCWDKFSLESIHYISRHTDLTGDPVLGADAQQRFLPTRFNAKGNAVDAHGLECPDMACPRCHLRIPDSIIDLDSFFYSIIGAPASGKSYFTTSLIWRLRKILPQKLDLAISDADGVSNMVLNRYDQLLFNNPNHSEYVALPKTELQGNEFTNQILFEGMNVNLPIPFVFKLQPLDTHHSHEDGKALPPRNMVLYDNAGEHFEPGREQITNLATSHLSHSSGLIFLFDPSKDGRMITKCNPEDPQVNEAGKVTNQMALLNEMISRIRRYTGMKATEKYLKPLLIVVPKYDMWREMFPVELKNEEPLKYDEANMRYRLDVGCILKISYLLRDLLLKLSPEIISVAEVFAEQVFFIPVSALGQMPEYDKEHDMIAVKPDNLAPVWAEVPLLLLLSYQGYLKSCLQPLSETQMGNMVTVEKYRIANNMVVFSIPGKNERVVLPSLYLGNTLYDADAKVWFKLPHHKYTDVPKEQQQSFWDK